MDDISRNFGTQVLTISNKLYTVELLYGRSHNQQKTLSEIRFDKMINVGGTREDAGVLIVDTIPLNDNPTSCVITGINDGIYLHTSDATDDSCSVKLVGNVLLLSLGFKVMAFDVELQEIKWSIAPDSAAVFEFYTLSDDILLRGELQIHRIDLDGNVKWSYGGRDIWVNIDGKKEVQIEKDTIHLTDFVGNKYVIDYDGKTLEDHFLD